HCWHTLSEQRRYRQAVNGNAVHGRGPAHIQIGIDHISPSKPECRKASAAPLQVPMAQEWSPPITRNRLWFCVSRRVVPASQRLVRATISIGVVPSLEKSSGAPSPTKRGWP